MRINYVKPRKAEFAAHRSNAKRTAAPPRRAATNPSPCTLDAARATARYLPANHYTRWVNVCSRVIDETRCCGSAALRQRGRATSASGPAGLALQYSAGGMHGGMRGGGSAPHTAVRCVCIVCAVCSVCSGWVAVDEAVHLFNVRLAASSDVP